LQDFSGGSSVVQPRETFLEPVVRVEILHSLWYGWVVDCDLVEELAGLRLGVVQGDYAQISQRLAARWIMITLTSHRRFQIVVAE
jgi:hypothetical protein